MELTQLKYFIRLANLLNFTEAAKSLFITQSTLSISIKQLEEELGTNLFDRIGKKVYLTDAGSLFFKHVCAALNNIDEGIQEINISKEIYKGQLTIGVTYSTSDFLNSRITEYTQKYPNVKLVINMYNTVDEVMSNLTQNKLDLAITYKSEKLLPSINVCDVSDYPLQAVVAKNHPLAKKKDVTFADMEEYPIITFSKGMHTRSMIDRLFYENQAQLEPKIEVNDTNIILDVIHKGLWISILSPLSIQNKENYSAIPIIGKQEMLSVCVIWLKDKSKQALLNTLLQILI